MKSGLLLKEYLKLKKEKEERYAMKNGNGALHNNLYNTNNLTTESPTT
jgi:hypothetical protein